MDPAPSLRALLLLGASAALVLLPAAGAALQQVAPLPVEGARDLTGAGLAFVELTASPESPFVHEPVVLRLRLGFEPGFGEQSLIQPFRRPLDVPAQVQSSWLAAPSCARLLAPEASAPPGESGPRFALNQAVVPARHLGDLEVGGRPYTVIELEQRWLPTCAGELTIPAVILRFAFATSFRDDLLHGRVAEDRRDAFVRGEPLVLRVRPLPEQGRPVGFTGAVGHLRVVAEATPRELELGQGVKLVLSIHGDGDLEHFDAPRLDGLADFHVRGWVEEHAGSVRAVTYDLAPRQAGPARVPAIEFTYFDPSPPAGYLTVTTAPIPIEVRPRAVAALTTPPDSPGETQGQGPGPQAPPGAGFEAQGSVLVVLAVLVALLALVVGLVVGLVVALRSRAPAHASPDPLLARVHAAAQAFRDAQSATAHDAGDALAAFLARCLELPVTAVIGSDVRARLVAADLPPELAQRAAALLEALVGARYGGPPADQSERSTRELVAAIESWAANPGPAR